MSDATNTSYLTPFWSLITDYAGPFRTTLNPSTALSGLLFLCATPSRHLLVFAALMCTLFAIDTNTAATVRIAGTGLSGCADGSSKTATFNGVVGAFDNLILSQIEQCVYVTNGSGVRRITINPKYFVPPTADPIDPTDPTDPGTRSQ